MLSTCAETFQQANSLYSYRHTDTHSTHTILTSTRMRRNMYKLQYWYCGAYNI